MESQAEQTSPKSKLERLKEELAKTEAALAKKREDRAALAKKISALENPKLTRKQDAAVKIAKGVAVVEWLKRRPDLQAEFDAVLAETTKNNTVRELLGLSPLSKSRRKPAAQVGPDQDTAAASDADAEDVDCTTAAQVVGPDQHPAWDQTTTIFVFPHPPGSRRERGEGGTWLGIRVEDKEEAKAVARAAGGRIYWDKAEGQWWTNDVDLSPYSAYL